MDEATTIDAEFSAAQSERKPPLAIMPAPPRASLARLTRQDLADITEERILLAEFIKANMVEGEDFGVIPGTKKKSLLKPGAEKLVSLFRCIPEYTFTDHIQEWDKGNGFFHYEFKCQILTQSGVVVAVGVGSANSREGKYRWRDAQRKCPQCGKFTIWNSKDGPGYFCWKKKEGCGATFDAGDQSIESQQVGKIENDDIAGQVNTILKMAKKRALVDGAISLARCSDMFTQDVEDMGDGDVSGGGSSKLARDSKPPADQSRPYGAAKKCPKCGVASIIPSKFGGFFCFKAKGGCDAKFKTEAELLGTEGTPPEDPRATRVKKLVADFKAKQGDPSQMKEWIGKVLGQPKTSAELTDGELDQLEATVNIVEDIPF